MPRPTTKKDLIEASNINFTKLWQIIDAMPERILNTEFDFSDDLKKKEAHWQRDKNLKDVLIHLYEWHQLLLNWVESNHLASKSDHKIAFLPEPYNWKTYGEMNIVFRDKHQNTPLNKAKTLIKSSHDSVLALVESLSNEALFTKKYFNWTGSTSLGSYCVSTMPSHYDWAIKKLNAHIKKHK